MPVGLIVGSIGAAAAVGSLAVGAYAASTQAGEASTAENLAKGTAATQAGYNAQLQQLIANPNSFFSSAPYQAAFNQGTTAVARSQAAQGFLGSANAGAAEQAFGQTFGASQLASQEQLLASLSGAGAASSPAQAVGAAASASSGASNTLSGVLASLGFSYGLYNQGGGGGSPGLEPVPNYSIQGADSTGLGYFVNT